MSGFMPRTMNVVVKSAADTAVAARMLRNIVKEVDPAAAVSGIASMQTVIDRTIAQPRLLAWTFGAFAVLALVVAGLGVYAVTSFAVGTRTPEFGVRMALGARPVDVLWLVVAGGVPPILVGTAAGLLGAVAASQLLRNLLFGVEPLDPSSLGAGAVVIAAAAGAATFLPARRAARVDPVTALRD
jgi:ABC-type antimicrobial peptide transport system permease subunit